MVLVFNPQLGFLSNIVNGTGTAQPSPSVQPVTTASCYYQLGISPTSSVISATAVPLDYQHTPDTTVTSNAISNGTGYSRWLGTEFKIRESSTAYNEGGTIHWIDGREGRGLASWWHGASVGTGTHADMSMLAMSNAALSTAHPLVRDWTHLRAIPSTPEDQLFNDIPQRSAHQVGPTNEYVADTEIWPVAVGQVANQSFRIAAVIQPASAVSTVLELEVRSWYDLHYVSGEGSVITGTELTLPIPINPDTTHINAAPGHAAAYSNHVAQINGALTRGATVPAVTTSPIARLVKAGAGMLGRLATNKAVQFLENSARTVIEEAPAVGWV